MKKIFITAIGGDIGYGVIKALKKSRYNFVYIGCDTKKYNYSFDEVDKFYIAPSYEDEKGWLDFILDTIKENDIDYFWPITEAEIRITNNNIKLFKNYSVVINRGYILEIALDKKRTSLVLKEAGIDTPATTDSLGKCDSIFPKVVKEKFDCGSHGVRIVNTEKELKDTFLHMKNPIVQQYVGNTEQEYTMTVFSDGKIVNSIVFKRVLGFGGMSRFVELVKDDVAEEIAEKIAKLLNLKGSINVQMRKEEGKYYIFEINPRISSTIGFRVQLGFNDVEWWIGMLEKNIVEKYVMPSRKAYGVRNVEEKIFFD